MAVATRYQIQKEVFGGSDERVLVIVSVTKSGRKKKASFLVISGQCCLMNDPVHTVVFILQ